MRYRALFLGLCLLVTPVLVQAQSCMTALVNRQGASFADVTVSTTAVIVLPSNTSRCTAILQNTAVAANTARCMPTLQGTPTSTVGYLIIGGASLVLGREAQQEWRCIRAGAADATIGTVEGLP